MESPKVIALNYFLVILMALSCSSQAHTFYVGGKDGWVADPTENYIHWAERNRFQVNDSLIFKYKAGSDSVLEVSEDDYNKCNKGKPIQTLKNGESEFKFHRSGPFYFISGNAYNCEKGQKLIVVVLFPRQRATTEKAPSPVAKVAIPPSSQYHSPSRSRSPSPSPSPSGQPPVSPPQAMSPSTAPFQVTPDLAPAPSPSAASVSRGSTIGSLLGFSLMVIVVLSSLL